MKIRLLDRFEKNKAYKFSIDAYQNLLKEYNLNEPTNKMKQLDGRLVRIVSESIGNIPNEYVWVRPEFCREA